ncbi:MAG: hypothetical protein AAFV19_04835 [Pseudomonadota bacterium]
MYEIRAEARPAVIVVLGPWSSGTSAVAGALAALGANAHPPHFAVDDALTPASFESMALRRIVLPHFDEQTLTRHALPPWLVARLRVWAGPGLSVAKLPVLAYFMLEIARAWSARFVIVRRDLAAIEQTRLRRGWPEIYGRAGAERIYAEITRALPAGAPRVALKFDDLRTDPAQAGEALAAFAGLPPNPKAVARAVRR